MLLLLVACQPDPDDSKGETGDTGGPYEPWCDEAEARLGYRACVPRIPDEATFEGVTVTSSTVDALRVGKYIVPAGDVTELPPAFLDVNNFPLHYDFLTQAYPDWFAGLTTEQYQDLVLYPETREYYAGTMSLYIDGTGFFYGFTVWDDPADSSSTVTMEDVAATYDQLQERFAIGDLYFVPNSEDQEAAVTTWTDAPFPIHGAAEVDYEAYNPGDAYGYLRLYTLDEFTVANEEATYGYQDIVVIEEAPEDLTRVVSGIVTGTRQGTLSHLNVRSSTRGTPNCYIKEPLDALAEWEDQIVHLDCAEDDWSIESATVGEAEAWWEEMRPDPVEICTPDLNQTDLPALLDLDTSTAEARATNLCGFGAKGANLSTLYHIVDPQYQLEGFLIPFWYYTQFVENGTWTVDLGDGEGEHTFQETLDVWNADSTFTTDATVRSAKLEELRAAMMSAPVDPDTLDAISQRIRDRWGGDTTMVRFRSSSNAEDGLTFAGAGLYDSESGCLADDEDGNSSGPSKCDEEKDDERTVEDALRTVWSSLWKMSAYDERDWYGIDQSQVAMGILADTRSNNEVANAVAFSGNPSADDDDRYLVNAQLGELEVVSAEPGVYPEQTLLTLDGGTVTEIDRVSPSSEADMVLTDEQLEEIGGVFWDVAEVFPLDDEVPEGHDVLWDTEWKYIEDGTLIIKQIRPFLR